jgi:hypothetical protein
VDIKYCILLNYTPHPVRLHTGLGESTIESQGEARAAEITSDTITLGWDQYGDCGMSQDVPLAIKRYGDVTGLPEPQEHVLYIVSTLVQQALPQRSDLVSPDRVIRDEQGRVTGCRGFYRLAK